MRFQVCRRTANTGGTARVPDRWRPATARRYARQAGRRPPTVRTVTAGAIAASESSRNASSHRSRNISCSVKPAGTTTRYAPLPPWTAAFNAIPGYELPSSTIAFSRDATDVMSGGAGTLPDFTIAVADGASRWRRSESAVRSSRRPPGPAWTMTSALEVTRCLGRPRYRRRSGAVRRQLHDA